MTTNTTLFDYELPEEFIAQTPAAPRDSSRLMVLDRATGDVAHRRFVDLVDELNAGDVLVFNTSKVFKARLALAGKGEMFVLRIRDGEADVLLRPGKKFPMGAVVVPYAEELVDGFVVQSKTADGVFAVATGRTSSEMLAFCEAHGSVPTPPYMRQGVDAAAYQTMYAKEVGSVAAPTAGLHFTPELLARIRAKGVQTEEVVLHVGLGTFRPLQTATLEEHVMHSEWVSLADDVAARLVQAKREGRRIIAVGTTTVRVLEGIAANNGSLIGYEGEVNMFITPGYAFAVIDGLITNFHLPKSTLLVLVSAFAGTAQVRAAYETAKQQRYRFFSFGDAMFIR